MNKIFFVLPLLSSFFSFQIDQSKGGDNGCDKLWLINKNARQPKPPDSKEKRKEESAAVRNDKR